MEVEAESVGLYINEKKTEMMHYGHTCTVSLNAKSGSKIKEVDNFKYLGAWMASTEKYVKVRKALAWKVCRKTEICKSSLQKSIKIFTATVESVLLYVMRYVDAYAETGKSSRWHVHSHAENGTQYLLAESHHK